MKILAADAASAGSRGERGFASETPGRRQPSTPSPGGATDDFACVPRVPLRFHPGLKCVIAHPGLKAKRHAAICGDSGMTRLTLFRGLCIALRVPQSCSS